MCYHCAIWFCTFDVGYKFSDLVKTKSCERVDLALLPVNAS